MQIRELNFKELFEIYELVSQLYVDMDYDEFEDLIYDMRDTKYKMIGIFEKDELISYAGVSIQTNLYHKRHLFVYELITKKEYQKQGYAKMMLEYLIDYAKIGMCKVVVLHAKSFACKWCKSSGFVRDDVYFVREL